MKDLTPIFSDNEMFYCSVPVPSINAHKGADFDFTAEQIAGYGQSQTHPSIVYIPDGWNGHKYWLATTPYPHAIDVFENPCIYYGDEDADGNPPRIFHPINGVVSGDYIMTENPVVKVFATTDVNSDPDLLFDSANQMLYMISRKNAWSMGYPTFVQKSLSGQAWTQRGETVAESIINGNDIPGGGGQPALIKYGDKFRFYYNLAGLSKPNEASGNGLASINMIEGTSLSLPSDFAFFKKIFMGGKSTIHSYHIDVFIDDVKNKYYLIFCGFNMNIDSTARFVYLAESEDGNTWYMFPRPLLSDCSKAGAYYRPTACIRQSDRMLIVYWSTTSGISSNPADYPNGASDVPVDGRTIGLSYGNFDAILARLKEDFVTNKLD